MPYIKLKCVNCGHLHNAPISEEDVIGMEVGETIEYMCPSCGNSTMEIVVV